MALVKMYHEDNEIEVQAHSVETMKARGWSTEKPIPLDPPLVKGEGKRDKKAADTANNESKE